MANTGKHSRSAERKSVWAASDLRPWTFCALLAFQGASGAADPPENAAEPDDGSPPAAEAPAQEPETAAPAEVETVPVFVAEEAADSGATELDTIEVTASKRIKSQRDLPGSVGAIRGADLEKIQAQGMADYMKLIPGVSLIGSDYDTGEQVVIIRGIASQFGGFTGLTTGIYVDEMPFGDLFLPLSVPDLNPFDLERVEVLKGPQGTLFGSGALAGAVRYVLQKPNHSVWQTKVSGTVQQTKFSEGLSQVGGLAQNIPLFGDTAALRFVGVYREEPGLLDIVPGGNQTRNEKDVNKIDQYTGRLLGSWNVSDRFKVSGFGFLQQTDVADISDSRSAERPERDNQPFPSPRDYGFGGVNLAGQYDFDSTQLLYTGTSLRKEVHSRAYAGHLLGDSFAQQEATNWYNQLIMDSIGQTHELRWSSKDAEDWEWLVGAAYMNYVQEFFQFTPNPGPPDSGYYKNPPEEPEDVPTADRASSFLWATVDGDGTEIAAFGEATRRLGERWEVTVGGRQFETELVADTALAGGQINALFPGETVRRDRYVTTAKGFNPKFAMRYMHDNHMQASILAAKGFQFGGFQVNPPAPGFAAGAEDAGFHFGSYDSSDLWNYELSLRTEWLDRRLRFDTTLFYQDWTDLQMTVQVPVNPMPLPVPAGSGLPEDVPFGLIVNVGAAHSEGLEAALEVLPFSGATFTSSAAWISAMTDEAFDHSHPDGPVPAGTRLPGTPRFQWANQFAYQFAVPFFSSWSSSLALTHSHIGTSPNSIRPNFLIGGYDTLDARFNLLPPVASPYVPRITLGMNNLMDVRGIAVGAESGGDGAYILVRPRTSILSLAWQH
jgi:iron complex outermembrane recepter protein